MPPKDGFIFFGSFLNAIELLPFRMRHKAYEVVVRYGILGEKPPDDTPSRIMQVFVMAKPTIDNMERLRQSGWKRKNGSNKTASEQYENISEDDNGLINNDIQNEKEN